MSYEVGRGKPPKSTQFKKGQSGNPKGRPKGSGTLLKVLEADLAKKIPLNEGGKTRLITKKEAMVMALTHAGIKGDTKAAALVFAYLTKHAPAALEPQAEPELNAAEQKTLDDYMDRELERRAAKLKEDE